MKILLTIASVAVLAGCATQPAQRNYATTYPQPADPSQWHVVSVTPVAPGTRDRLAAGADNGSSVQYTSEPITSNYAPQRYYAPGQVYGPQPVYVAPPMYAPAPAYYYPPVSIGLDFMFGRSWGGHRGHRGHHHRGGHNWGGVGIGSRWHR